MKYVLRFQASRRITKKYVELAVAAGDPGIIEIAQSSTARLREIYPVEAEAACRTSKSKQLKSLRSIDFVFEDLSLGTDVK